MKTKLLNILKKVLAPIVYWTLNTFWCDTLERTTGYIRILEINGEKQDLMLKNSTGFLAAAEHLLAQGALDDTQLAVNMCRTSQEAFTFFREQFPVLEEQFNDYYFYDKNKKWRQPKIVQWLRK